MMINIEIILVGSFIGLLVGSTGIAGASILTPVLISMGIPIKAVIGTDLLYNTINKSFSTYVHWKYKNIDFQKLILLLKGSIPGSIITGLLINNIDIYFFSSNIKAIIGIVIILTILLSVFTMIFKVTIFLDEWKIIFISFFLGSIVCLTSIGAGILFTTLLLFSKIKLNKIIGTDICHAVIITGISSIFHMSINQVDYILLFNLLIGSIPATYISSKYSNKVPSKLLYIIINILILYLAFKLIF